MYIIVIWFFNLLYKFNLLPKSRRKHFILDENILNVNWREKLFVYFSSRCYVILIIQLFQYQNFQQQLSIKSWTMNQTIVRCHLCEPPIPPLHCVICSIHLCEDFEGEHLSDKSKKHKVVPFKYRGSFHKCPTNSTKICEHFCEQCDILICELYVSFHEHQTYDEVDTLKS